jgi:hypothetical protein
MVILLPPGEPAGGQCKVQLALAGPCHHVDSTQVTGWWEQAGEVCSSIPTPAGCRTCHSLTGGFAGTIHRCQSAFLNSM